MAEVEARVLSSAALTRVFSHLHLRDPDANLDELLEPVDSERFAAAAEAVKIQVEALLGKFRAFLLRPRQAVVLVLQSQVVAQVVLPRGWSPWRVRAIP